MADENSNSDFIKSDWNAHVAFQGIFFSISSKCREFQAIEDFRMWKNCIIAKMSHIQGILTEEEKNSILQLRKKVNNAYYEYLNSKRGNNLSQTLSSLYDILFNAESEIDTITNGHISFVNVDDMPDITDF